MIKLRKLEKKDLKTRVEWMNDPRIYKTMHYTPPITFERTLEWFKKNQNNESRLDFALEEDGVVVAMNGLTGIDHIIKKAESYTIVKPGYNGRGIGTKSLFLKSIYGFKIREINKIFAYIDMDNVASKKIYERLGYKVEGILRQEVARDSVLIDRCYVGCFEDELNETIFDYEIVNNEMIIR